MYLDIIITLIILVIGIYVYKRFKTFNNIINDRYCLIEQLTSKAINKEFVDNDKGKVSYNDILFQLMFLFDLNNDINIYFDNKYYNDLVKLDYYNKYIESKF